MNVTIMRSDAGMPCQKKIHNRQKFKRRAKQLVQRSPELEKKKSHDPDVCNTDIDTWEPNPFSKT